MAHNKEVAMKSFFNVMAGVLFTLAFAPYIWAILHKRVRNWKSTRVWSWLDWATFVRPEHDAAQPIKATWIIWASLDTITFAGMYAKHALNVQISSAIVMAWLTVALAMKFGLPGWRRVDILCLLGGVVGIALWAVFDSPVLGLSTSLATIFLGSIPTFVSAWEVPTRESLPAWLVYWASCVCALIAVPQWTIEDAAQPMTFFAVESTMVAILLTRKFVVKKLN